MKYNFDTIPDREGKSDIKYDMRREVFSRADVIPLWIADMDFEVAPPITEAILRRAGHKVYGYDFRSEATERSLVSWLARRNGWTISHEWIRLTPGVVSGIAFALRALTREGDGVVIQPPVYPPFAAITRESGRRVIENPLKRVGDGFEIDFDDLDRKLAQAKAIVVCNPHNPTGKVFTRAELTQIAALCEKHDVAIISDEIHSDLIFAPSHHTHIASISADSAARTLTFVAPSKSFNIAGLATSAAIISNDEMRQRFDKTYALFHVEQGTVFGREAMRAAYDECEDWLGEVIEYLHGNIEYVRGFIRENIPLIRTNRQEGTYLMWLDCNGFGMAHRELVEFMVREAGLGLTSGADFGTGGEGCMRLNAATNRATLERSMHQLAEACRRRGL